MKRKYSSEEISPTIEKHVQIKKIEFMGQGVDSEAFCVNDEMVFKFPKRQSASKSLGNEIQLLKRIQGMFDVEVPCVLFEGTFQNLIFFASKRLKGRTLTQEEFLRLPTENAYDVAQTLARFLKQLHSLDPQKRRDLVRLHGDFSLDHILFENGRVSGILDFADTRIGKVQSDFEYLLDEEDDEEFGGNFGLKVLEIYRTL